jgi:hypothetical protein
MWRDGEYNWVMGWVKEEGPEEEPAQCEALASKGFLFLHSETYDHPEVK